MKATNTLTGESIRIRPSDRTDGILRRAAELALANLVKEYPKDFGAASEREDTLNELESAIEYSHSGFDRCTTLSRRGWEITDDMVEIMADDYVERAVTEAIRAWVKDEGIVPSLAIGAQVVIMHEGCRDGIVVAIHEDDATYTVRVHSLGHVDASGPVRGTIGFVLPFEVVEDQP